MFEELMTLADCEAAAQRRLPKHVWDYIGGGASEEITLGRNGTALTELVLRPRFLRDVVAPDLTTTVLGTEISLPVVLSPAAFQANVHPDGEIATAAGAGRARTLTVVPAADGSRIASIAEAAQGPLWLQIYHSGRESTGEWARRAEAAGYRALCITVDVPVQNPKERDRRNWFLPPYGEVRYALHQPTFPELRLPGFPFSLADLDWLRSVTSLPIVLKGIMTAEDAAAGVDGGAAGILVSNHGGRLVDTAPSTIEVLPDVISAVDGRAEVYLDSGIRRGADVLKALALGARAVGVGRPWFWGLAIGGPDGVERVLEILRFELEVAMAYCGQFAIGALEDGVVSVPAGWGPGTPVPAPGRVGGRA